MSGETLFAADLLFGTKPGIMAPLSGVPIRATLAQSAEQTLRKRQVMGSSPMGGLINIGRPQRFGLGPLLYRRKV